jgi:tRNA (guanine-N7-)-methyltransferase
MDYPDFLPSFVRNRGRALRDRQMRRLEELLPSLEVAQGETPLDPAALFGGRQGDLRVEIGFGGGEHLAEQAKRWPEIHFIGCEPYLNGVVSLLGHIEREDLRNIRLYQGDGRAILKRLPPESVARIDLLFPDPWPKTRHHKRRIVSQETLVWMHRALRGQGVLRLATDHAEYGVWMLEKLLASGLFRWTAERAADWENPPADWVATRYQEKALALGKEILYLEWKKDGDGENPRAKA